MNVGDGTEGNSLVAMIDSRKPIGSPVQIVQRVAVLAAVTMNLADSAERDPFHQQVRPLDRTDANRIEQSNSGDQVGLAGFPSQGVAAIE